MILSSGGVDLYSGTQAAMVLMLNTSPRVRLNKIHGCVLASGHEIMMIFVSGGLLPMRWSRLGGVWFEKSLKFSSNLRISMRLCLAKIFIFAEKFMSVNTVFYCFLIETGIGISFSCI